MPVVLYPSWRDFPPGEWRWPNFSPAEMACRGDATLMIHAPSLDKLQALRIALGKPMVVLSAYRSPAHNKAVGGAKHSQHLAARAFDISMANHDPESFERAARAAGFTGFGFYPRQNFMHIDTGPAREWGTRFPPRPQTRKVETAEEQEAGEAADAETERFAPEPQKPTVIEAITKPEVIGPVVGTGLTGFIASLGDLIRGSVPLQIALAVLFVAIPLGIGWWMMHRQRSIRHGD